MVSRKDKKIIDEALTRFERWSEDASANNQMCLEDVRFVDDEDCQWTEDAKNAREGRPCMTFDKVSGACDQVIGDMLQNKPGIKIRAAEDGDQDVAEIYTGLIRAIENTSRSKRAYSTAFKFAVKGGYGVWRIRHDYADDESFFQDVLIEPVHNPFSVLFDSDAQEVTKEDGVGVFVFDDMNIDEFERKYPKAQSKAGQFDSVVGTGWMNDDTVRVAEYFRKVPQPKTICQLSDGSIVDKEDYDESDELEVVNEREVDGYKIEYYKITACEILEKIDYKGKFIPLIPLYGKNVNLDGEFKFRGMVRKAKDAQRAYNYELSNHVEFTSLQPKAPWLATPEMIKGQEEQLANLNVGNEPVIIFNADPQVPGALPQRQAPPQSSSGMLTTLQFMSDNIKAATNIYDASMGNRSNESSGRAIMERDRQGDTATFEFTDELVESLQYSGRVIIDLIPKIYDTQRQIRILGEDMTEEVQEVNKTWLNPASGDMETINDLARGKYDITVSAGASYSTRRTETADQLGQIMAQNPQMAQVLGDIWVQSLDLIGGDEVIKRLRKIGIKQGFVEPNEEEQQEMAPAQQQNAQMQQAAQQLQQRLAQAEVAEKEADAVKKQAEAKTEQTEALLNSIDAQLKQVELAQEQGNYQAMMTQMQMLRRMVGK